MTSDDTCARNRLFVAGGKLPKRPKWTYLNSSLDKKANVCPKIVGGQKAALTVDCAGGLRPGTELLLKYDCAGCENYENGASLLAIYTRPIDKKATLAAKPARTKLGRGRRKDVK